jgi:hypothetical protein
MVKIVDEKYGVNGCYQTDPTFSSNLERDYYPTALMTVNEAHASSLNYYYDNSVIYASESYEEFAIRIRKMAMKNRYGLKSLLENMDKLKNLNESFTNMDSYKTFNSLIFKDEEHAYELLSDERFVMNLYDHIKKTYQSPISGNVLIEAIKIVKRVENPNISESELDEMMSTIIDDNIMAYDHYFPPITIEGAKAEIFANKYNKFITATQENIKSV